MNKITNIDPTSGILTGLTHNVLNPLEKNSKKNNIYMGIGIWSKKNGLSEGLPVDIIKMLLAAKVAALTLHSRRVIILIPDSMAKNEGADQKEVDKIILVYRKCLASLIDLLNMNDCAEIMLSSKLEKKEEYIKTHANMAASESVKKLKCKSEHKYYIATQSTITQHMHLHENVGVKIGWVKAKGIPLIAKDEELSDLSRYDELEFDLIYKGLCPESRMQYLYVDAGSKHLIKQGAINYQEAPPYTAFSADHRYTMQTSIQKSIVDTCPITESRKKNGLILLKFAKP